MSAPATHTAAPMRVLIRGKPDASRTWDKSRYTRIITPAPDPCSRPQTVEVRSKAQLGSKGEEVSVLTQLGGYTRQALSHHRQGDGGGHDGDVRGDDAGSRGRLT